jgi:hypothetical protein
MAATGGCAIAASASGRRSVRSPRGPDSRAREFRAKRLTGDTRSRRRKVLGKCRLLPKKSMLTSAAPAAVARRRDLRWGGQTRFNNSRPGTGTLTPTRARRRLLLRDIGLARTRLRPPAPGAARYGVDVRAAPIATALTLRPRCSRGCASARFQENFNHVCENYKTVMSLAREFAVS